MTTEDLYKKLDDLDSLSGHEDLLKEYLVTQLAKQAEGSETEERLAYEMAGLLSTKAVMALPRDNPYIEILQLAGSLELPLTSRSKSVSWDQLQILIQQLP